MMMSSSILATGNKHESTGETNAQSELEKAHEAGSRHSYGSGDRTMGWIRSRYRHNGASSRYVGRVVVSVRDDRSVSNSVCANGSVGRGYLGGLWLSPFVRSAHPVRSFAEKSPSRRPKIIFMYA